MSRMKNTHQGYEKDKLEDEETSDSVERGWQDINCNVKNKTKYKEVKIDIPLAVPQQVEPVIERASQKKLPSILMKTIADIDKDRLMGKRLVMNITKWWKDSNPLKMPSEGTCSFQ